MITVSKSELIKKLNLIPGTMDNINISVHHFEDTNLSKLMICGISNTGRITVSFYLDELM